MLLSIHDRQLTRSYLKAYLVVLVSLLSLFIIVDLFNNLDDFAQSKRGLSGTLLLIGRYYAFKTAEIFDRLAEAIALIAAMFTVAWMQRNNEILPLLSAGVSTRRIIRPVVISACLMLGLSALNQELVLPQVDAYLVQQRNEGDKAVSANGSFDSNDIHASGNLAIKQEALVKEFFLSIPPKIANNRLVRIQAKEARWEEPTSTTKGRWVLTGAVPPELENWNRTEHLEMIVPGKYYFYTQELDFETVTRPKNWFMYVDSVSLLQELGRGGNTARLASLAVVFHMRLTRPILGIILVFMGLAIILRDQNRNIFISAGLCLLICGAFFLAGFACRFLGNEELVSPTLAAWLPVLVFGPLAFVMFDAVHT